MRARTVALRFLSVSSKPPNRGKLYPPSTTRGTEHSTSCPRISPLLRLKTLGGRSAGVRRGRAHAQDPHCGRTCQSAAARLAHPCPWTPPNLSGTPQLREMPRSGIRHPVCSGTTSMPSSDRAFHALARESPQSLVTLLRCVAPRVVGASDAITPAEIDDPHLAALPPVVDADWVARVGEQHRVVHLECQGYRDDTFIDCVFRYHLHLALRYWGHRVFTVALWLLVAPTGAAPRGGATRGTSSSASRTLCWPRSPPRSSSPAATRLVSHPVRAPAGGPRPSSASVPSRCFDARTRRGCSGTWPSLPQLLVDVTLYW